MVGFYIIGHFCWFSAPDFCRLRQSLHALGRIKFQDEFKKEQRRMPVWIVRKKI
jgi:hypothetical protein